MKRGNKQILAIAISLLLVGVIIFSQIKITGKITKSESEDGSKKEFIGIPESEQRCMESCLAEKCKSGDMQCLTKNSEKCMDKCGVGPSAQNKNEQCMQDCTDQYCKPGPGYGTCMNKYLDKCEDKCNMKKSPDESEMDAEQLCISNCVAAENPKVICGNSKQGETGNALCQRCAKECVHLYKGPCLNDAKITEKEKECSSRCEHCYGSPVEGPSGEGWDCIVDIECKDASGEFGDEAGTGPGIGQEGYVNQEKKEDSKRGFIGNVFKSIGNFFKGLFEGR